MSVRAQELGADGLTIGLLFATGGIGGGGGAAITPWLHERHRFGDLVVGVTWAWVLTWVPYALAPNLLLLGVANVVGWLIVPMLYVTVSAYRLAVVPDELRGRVSSAYNLVTSGSQPLSLAVTGWLLATLGPAATILLITGPRSSSRRSRRRTRHCAPRRGWRRRLGPSPAASQHFPMGLSLHSRSLIRSGERESHTMYVDALTALVSPGEDRRP